jgi:hypothetical protein
MVTNPMPLRKSRTMMIKEKEKRTGGFKKGEKK